MSLQASFSVKHIDASKKNVVFAFCLTNTSTSNLNICKYYTPMERLCNNILHIIDLQNNASVPYQGIMCERAPPQSTDYIAIAAGATYTCDFELRFYPLQQNHTYSMTLKRTTMEHQSFLQSWTYSSSNIDVSCNTVQFVVA